MKKFLKFKIFNVKFVLLAIIFLALFLRLYGINWDQNQHLHPDERFLTMVTQAVKWPTSLPQYLNPKMSPLSPYNAGHNFFVYGTLPLKIVKFFSGIITFEKFDYNNITLVGRFISTMFDIGIVYLVYKIGEKVFNKKIGLLAGFLYAISVLPIQLSHFYAVDTFLVFFITLSFYLLLNVISYHQSSPNKLNSKSDHVQYVGYSYRNQAKLAPSASKQIPNSNDQNSKRLKHSDLENSNLFSFLCFVLRIFPLGISFGLALACKISALYFLPIILLGFLFIFAKSKNKSFATCYLLLATFTSYFAFRFADPRAFATNNLIDPTLNPQFIANIKQLKSFDNPNGFFPPAIQWLKTKPIVFPLKNMIFWGFGIPLGILTLAGIIFSFLQFAKKVFALTNFFKDSPCKLQGRSLLNKKCILIQRKKQFNSLTAYLPARQVQQFFKFLILFWILLLFFYQGIQFAKAMRYFYPIYPFLAIFSANFLYYCSRTVVQRLKLKVTLALSCLGLFILIFWPVSFISIYSRPHSRVVASEWIYQNIPFGSTISCEHWDDCLPFSLPNKNSKTYGYKSEMLELYNPDTEMKWQKINAQIENVDYIIMSSNRLWGSIPKVPEKYPITAKFYEDLFAEKLQWTKVAEIASYPTIPILNIKIPDDFSDESFTVYDHPKILIYKRL